MDICERIIRARDAGASIVRIEFGALQSPEEAALRLGLWKSAAKYEISASHATALLCATLVEDMAYSDQVVPLTDATDLASAFIAEFDGEEARYFTNASWRPASKASRNGNSLSLSGWNPATSATFDSGILVLTSTKIGCAWFMDED